jgi:hypothetical protein
MDLTSADLVPHCLEVMARRGQNLCRSIEQKLWSGLGPAGDEVASRDVEEGSRNEGELASRN